MENERDAPMRPADTAVIDGASNRRSSNDQSRRSGIARMGAALPLTLLSAILFLVGFWSPWLYETLTITFKTPGPVGPTFFVSGSDVTLSGVLSFVLHHPAGLNTASPVIAFASLWDGLPFVGIVLAVALWRSQTRPRWLMVIYMAWLVFATALTGLGAYRTSVLLTQPNCPGSCANSPVVYHTQLAWGLFVTLFALALAWAALVAPLRHPVQVDATQDAIGSIGSGLMVATGSYRRSRVYLLASGVFTLGLALWAAGLFFTPWLTAGCSGVPIAFAHFSRGSCMGLDGYDMLIAGLNHMGRADDQSLAVGALRLMYALTFAGVVVVWLLWAPGQARLTRLVGALGALWALLAMLMFLIGWQGTASNLGQPAQLVFAAQGAWGIGPGVWLCAAGIVLAWVGGVMAWAHRWFFASTPREDVHALHVIGG